MLLVAVDDSASGFGSAAAIEGKTKPEIISRRRLAFGGEHAQKREAVIAAILPPLIAERKAQRSTNVAVARVNRSVCIRGKRDRPRRRLTGCLEEHRRRSDKCHAANDPPARPE